MKQDTLTTSTLTVSDIVERVRVRLLPLNPILVQGEIASHVLSRAGHHYFELKDDKAKIRCVLFKGAAVGAAKPDNGMMVKIHARVDVYGPMGSLQFKVDGMENIGDGALQIRFEKLKKKLAEEGLFDVKHKRTIPAYPERVLLITSGESAAYHDVCRTLGSHWPVAKLSLISVNVQGKNSRSDLVNALDYANRDPIRAQFDVVLLVRGGGSLDDLWSFNEEDVVRAVHRLRLPLISGIGHEIDTTLVDLVADHRGATPTAAAVAVAKGKDEVRNRIEELRQTCDMRLRHRLLVLEKKVSEIGRVVTTANPQHLIENLFQHIDLLLNRGENQLNHIHHLGWRNCQLNKNKLIHSHPGKSIEIAFRAVADQADDARNFLGQIFERLKEGITIKRLRLAKNSARQVWDNIHALFRQHFVSMTFFHPERIIDHQRQRLADSRDALSDGGFSTTIANRLDQKLDYLSLYLRSNPPDKAIGKLLRRGFALVRDQNNELIREKSYALSQARIQIEFADGKIRATPIPDDK